MKDCNQCGKCCILYGNGGLSASDEEIDRWADERPDIFSYVSGGKIWISPETGEALPRCPWLDKVPGEEIYLCRIYYDRPADCRYYPVDIEQMVRDECEMLEPHDLVDARKAQRKLDDLMADSRPPFGRD